MKTRILISLLVLMGVLIVSCNNDNNNGPVMTTTNYTATLTGASETPPDTSHATGTATLVFNPATNILSGTITFTGLTPTAGHIHKGAVGVAGNVIFPLGNAPFTSPISFTSPVLTSAQISDLNSGLYYVNLHTAAFPNGEIRGQLLKSGSSNTGGSGGGGGGGY